MARIPDVRLDFYLVQHGYQVDVFVGINRIAALCRDYGGRAASRAEHIEVLLEELEAALRRLRERFAS